MIRFGRTAQMAVSAVSLLAEVYDGGNTRLSSHDIAQRRQLPQPIVAKVLTILSSLGLVDGSRGPGGGYWLKHAPDQITLFQIVEEFERLDAKVMCPFGPGWCGVHEPCPMHDTLVTMEAQWTEYLRTTTLAQFQNWQPAAKPAAQPPAAKRHAKTRTSAKR